MTNSQKQLIFKAKQQGCAEGSVFTWDILHCELNILFGWDAEQIDHFDDELVDYFPTRESLFKAFGDVKIDMPPKCPNLAMWLHLIADRARVKGIEFACNYAVKILKDKHKEITEEQIENLIHDINEDIHQGTKGQDERERFCANVAEQLIDLNPNEKGNILQRWIAL